MNYSDLLFAAFCFVVGYRIGYLRNLSSQLKELRDDYDSAKAQFEANSVHPPRAAVSKTYECH